MSGKLLEALAQARADGRLRGDCRGVRWPVPATLLSDADHLSPEGMTVPWTGPENRLRRGVLGFLRRPELGCPDSPLTEEYRMSQTPTPCIVTTPLASDPAGGAAEITGLLETLDDPTSVDATAYVVAVYGYDGEWALQQTAELSLGGTWSTEAVPASQYLALLVDAAGEPPGSFDEPPARGGSVVSLSTAATPPEDFPTLDDVTSMPADVYPQFLGADANAAYNGCCVYLSRSQDSLEAFLQAISASRSRAGVRCSGLLHVPGTPTSVRSSWTASVLPSSRWSGVARPAWTT